jgi:protein-S-isoprenylcysteine O-methyltransferase Ste14
MKNKILVALLRILVVWALLFTGWGLDDPGGFFASPARPALLLILICRHIAEIFSLKTDPFAVERKLAAQQCWVPAISGLTGTLLCWLLPFNDRRGILTFSEFAELRCIGLIMFSTGAALQLVAQHTLGRQYSMYVALRNGHQLIQTGVYRLIRHPIYLGLILNMVGVSLTFRSLLAIPLLVIVAAFLAWRIRQEDAMLNQEFGADFARYRHVTRRFFPYLRATKHAVTHVSAKGATPRRQTAKELTKAWRRGWSSVLREFLKSSEHES